jgi:hypothetical protein
MTTEAPLLTLTTEEQTRLAQGPAIVWYGADHTAACDVARIWRAKGANASVYKRQLRAGGDLAILSVVVASQKPLPEAL